VHNIVLFGELLMRLEPPRNDRFVQASSLDIGFTGAEANAGVVLAEFGDRPYLVSAVPEHDLGQACLNHMRRYRLDVRHVQRRGNRLGLLFVESGAGYRASQVIYDRANSSFAQLKPGDVSWAEVLRDKHWFHFTGTAPALSPGLAEVTLQACQAARDSQIPVSCDVNYRSSLWSVSAARQTMLRIAPLLDVLIVNEEHAVQLLDAPSSTSDAADVFDPRRYEAMATFLRQRYDLRAVAITIRSGETADENRIAAYLSADDHGAMSRTYRVRPIDRIGAGDAFSGALIYALLLNWSTEQSVQLASAASCLKHFVRGDFSHCSFQETLALASGDFDGRIRR
jgi:2-dehydro-3-deoxygluconokinase